MEDLKVFYYLMLFLSSLAMAWYFWRDNQRLFKENLELKDEIDKLK